MLDRYKAVFFDAGGTLLHPFPSVGGIYEKVGRKYGCRAGAGELEKIFRAAWISRDGLSSLSGHSTEKVERQWWRHLVDEVYSQVGGVNDFDTFFNELYDVFGAPESWRLYPDVLEVLEALKKKGKFMGIVSNWDSRLFKLCDGLGIHPYFDFILASAVFGTSKPSVKIFEEALRLSEVSPAEAVHIGDSFQDDIKGARKAGIGAVLMDRTHEGRDDHHDLSQEVPIIRDLRELMGSSKGH